MLHSVVCNVPGGLHAMDMPVIKAELPGHAERKENKVFAHFYFILGSVAMETHWSNSKSLGEIF